MAGHMENSATRKSAARCLCRPGQLHYGTLAGDRGQDAMSMLPAISPLSGSGPVAGSKPIQPPATRFTLFASTCWGVVDEPSCQPRDSVMVDDSSAEILAPSHRHP